MIAPLFQIPCETWGNWMTGSCSVTCGRGTQLRTRFCIGGVAGSGGCPGSATETTDCNTDECKFQSYALPKSSLKKWRCDFCVNLALVFFTCKVIKLNLYEIKSKTKLNLL